MSFRRARLRQLKRHLAELGVVRDAVVVKILTFTGLPMPKIVRPPTGRLSPDNKPQPVKSADQEAKQKRTVIHCFFDGRDHVTFPGDANYEEILCAAPGDRPRLLGRQEGRNRGPVQYRKVMLA